LASDDARESGGGLARRGRLIAGISVLALLGLGLVVVVVMWLWWRETLESEGRRSGRLAEELGARTEAIILDTRNLLHQLDALEAPRCSPEHLQAMHEAAASRVWLRSLGHWQAATRVCGVGFLPDRGLKPPQADRIYDSGLVAWWPGPHTTVGPSTMFLLRFGDHDAALDPQLILREVQIPPGRKVALWVEGLRLAELPQGADLKPPEELAEGMSLDASGERVWSRYRHRDLLPIDVVAEEPVEQVWGRHRAMLGWGALVGVGVAAVWLQWLLLLTRRKLSLAGELLAAIDRGELETLYQPVLELHGGRCVGAEALLRWHRREGEPIGPSTFIPLAEREGFITRLTLHCLHHVIRDLSELRRLSPALSINLNLAPDDLRDPQFADELGALLEQAGLPPSAVKLEITERALINSDTSRNLIRGFRTRGHQVAIDDFGTGYSSLSYLQSFELDVLKIDKSFVDAIGTTSATSQVIVHIIEMAASLGLECVAEGVETEEQLQWLRAHGVRHGQGYLFSRPLDLRAFTAYLRAGEADRGDSPEA
jgi:sensor c-di-GMP phosphodiesterase-like protein